MGGQFKNTNWYSGFIFFADTKSGWTEELRQWGFPAIISPLHDKDPVRHVNTLGPDLLLPHYHVMIRFPDMDTDITMNILREMRFSSFRRPDRVGAELRDMCGIEDFVNICLCEKNQKEHIPSCVSYPTDEVINMNGTDYNRMAFIPATADKMFTEFCPCSDQEAGTALLNMIQAYQFLSLTELQWFLSDSELTPDSRWCKVYEDNRPLFDRYIKSRAADYIEGPVFFTKEIFITPEQFRKRHSSFPAPLKEVK